MKKEHGVTIREVYKDYVPPISGRDAIDALLLKIPRQYCLGLKTIVLTDAGGLSHDERNGKTWSRNRKVAIRNCLGLYHQKWKGEEAWIELFTDNIFALCLKHGYYLDKYKNMKEESQLLTAPLREPHGGSRDGE